ncbi:MAG: transposase [Nitrososphaerota archaeon]|nr:transposase [Nitrososphaerota archaeon]
MSSEANDMNEVCPECGGSLLYDISTKRHTCKNCGLYMTKEELRRLTDEKAKKAPSKTERQSEYLQWWLSRK